MSEPGPMAAGAAGTPAAPGGAGAMLRDARQAQGMHVAALAAAIKVPQAKLEALEAERFSELPDATFARALAQSMCRALKIDPAPVLARLPSAGPLALDKVEGGLNTPFRDRPGRIDPLMNRAWLSHPVTWVVLALLVGAAFVAFVPTDWLRSVTGSVAGGQKTGSAKDAVDAVPVFPPGSASAPMLTDPPERAYQVSVTPEAAAASAASGVDSIVAPPQAAGTTAPAASAVAASVAASASGNPNAVVQIRALDATWVQVSEPGGKVVYSRLVPAGETAGIDANLPLKVRIGNAKGTELRLRGQVVDMASSVRGNTATIDLR